MILSKLFKKRRATKMSMTEVLLSNSDNDNKQGLAEKTDTGRINIDGQADRNGERRGKSINNPAKRNER